MTERKEMTRPDIAGRCAELMLAADQASSGLGIQVVVTEAGAAEATMEVTVNMLNGHGVCHGGFVFALADTAFAFACNGYDDITLAAAATVEFLRPANAGDCLRAVARERRRGRTSGIYDVEVSNQQDKCVALFRGRSHSSGQPMLAV